MSEIEKVIVESASKDNTSDSLEGQPNMFDLNHDPPENKTPTILKLKLIMWVVGILLGRASFKNSLITVESY